MGSCRSKEEIISPLDKIKTPSQIILKETLSGYVEILLQDYEKILTQKIVPSNPQTMHEFDKIIKFTIQKALQKYKDMTINFSSKEDVQEEIKNYRLYLISKCKLKEGYFRFINNYHSFEFVYELKKNLIQELNDEKLTVTECVSEYKKLAKGSYLLEGLQDLHDAVELPLEKRLKFITNKANTIRQELEDNRNQLLRI
ncbi:hypothetical protein SteCoe_7017 [Stentor coeruleus]|uniref:Uncharacterized protein n=1 Tax=Stentor coeruleus TaxID=5963 RepID=A0A1R2CNM6_9CILI|nr:hypothetical protein SteCoe_7017 [Stentor coeruleus]